MTIARDFGGVEHQGEGSLRRDTRPAGADGGWSVPEELRRERLDAQIRSFERAGYRTETRAGLQVVLARSRRRRPVRDGVLAVATLGLSLVHHRLTRGRPHHRVVVTVDRSGAVRFV